MTDDEVKLIADSRGAGLDLPAAREAAAHLAGEVLAFRHRLAGGILLPGWFCPSCRIFNGAEKGWRTNCRGCGGLSPVALPPPERGGT